MAFGLLLTSPCPDGGWRTWDATGQGAAQWAGALGADAMSADSGAPDIALKLRGHCCQWFSAVRRGNEHSHPQPRIRMRPVPEAPPMGV